MCGGLRAPRTSLSKSKHGLWLSGACPVLRKGALLIPARRPPSGLLNGQTLGHQDPIAGYVHGLCVRNSYNGHGLGSFMLDWCANKVRELNRRYVRLDCAVHNAKLCTYYESLGFIRVGLHREPEPGGYVWSLYEKLA
jgi:ribosomal protein S18 acetylase RimI-like enzyme